MKDRGEKKFVAIPFFWSHEFHKIELFFFEMLKKKIWANFQRIIEHFLPKKLSLTSQKYGFGIRDPEKTYYEGVKTAPDPGSGSATLLKRICY